MTSWFDAAPCGLMQTEEDGTIRRVNATLCNWLGYTPSDLVDKVRFQDLLPVGPRMFHYTHWAPLLKMQGSVAEVKFQVLHRDGDAVPMVVNASRHDNDGVFVHELALYIARDRDRYEQELVRARKRLEEAVSELERLHAEEKERAVFAEQMIGIVSHDLRNPLGAIAMGTSLLVQGNELADSQRRVVERISRSTDRAARLIADLLDFTQARLGGGIAVHRRELHLHELVGETLDELRLAYPGRSLVHVTSGDGVCAADGSRLAQAIGNLVSNAVTYGKADAPITVRSLVEPGHCSIEVHNLNEHVPIPADALERIFEPMTRGTTATSSARSVGLGLFIVREIARAHGGTARVTSTEADGTTFELRWR